MKPKRYKLIVYVPRENSAQIREAFGKAGAGRIGNYDFASFSSQGVGRFRPLKGANPAIGAIGKLEEVQEERIETVVNEEDLGKVIQAVRAAHPYEEPVIEVLRLENIAD